MAKSSEYRTQVLNDRPVFVLSWDGDRERLWINGRATFGWRGFVNRLFRRY